MDCQTQHRKRSDAVRSPDFVQELQKKLLEDPGNEIRSLIREKNVRLVMMKLLQNEFLRHSSDKRRKAQRLTARVQDDHLKKARKLLNKPKHPEEPRTLGFFSEEKNFCQDQLQGQDQLTQNNRWLAFSPPEVPRVTKTRFPQIVMVFSCLSSEDDVMHFHIVKEGLRLKSDGYVELLSTVVKPWVDMVAPGRSYRWQQDSAPCQTSGKSPKGLPDNCFNKTSPNMWPPNSPYCNPMDYHACGAVERDTNHASYNAKVQLVTRVKAVL